MKTPSMFRSYAEVIMTNNETVKNDSSKAKLPLLTYKRTLFAGIQKTPGRTVLPSAVKKRNTE